MYPSGLLLFFLPDTPRVRVNGSKNLQIVAGYAVAAYGIGQITGATPDIYVFVNHSAQFWLMK